MAKRSDFLLLTILAFVFILLYLPVWSAEYLYTDEAVQLWYYGKEPGFKMFAQQGRLVTEALFQLLFGKVQLISGVRYIRIFSFLGWLATLPLWYFLLKRIFVKEGLNPKLAFLTLLFVICSPTVSISILWASCCELFLANISGFLSGCFIYNGIKMVNGRVEVPAASVLLPVLFGTISLFIYQNGFGFFFLPFIIHAVSPTRQMRYVWIGAGTCVFICVVYYLLFRYALRVEGLAASDRTSLNLAPWGKLRFFATRPMSSAFHYTFLFNEMDPVGYIIYAVLFGCWIRLFLLRKKEQPLQQRLKHLAILLTLLAATYFPSLLVRENYASNRTLLALNTAVWVLTAETFFYYSHLKKWQRLFIPLIVVIFCCNAWYNVNRLFLKPVRHEYNRLRGYVEQQYNTGVATIYFRRPQENFFVQHYGITRSWDEFGAPSTFRSWVPEHFVRQIVYEKTGDRNKAKALVINDWPATQAFDSVVQHNTKDAMFIAAEDIIRK